VLRALDVPMSTTAIAREMGLTPSTVSQHLSVLRDSGLVHSWRSGREVHYRQTAVAASFLSATNSRPAAANIA
jgi:DNA-binding transcriptional ArsR family regulator